jgi:DNA mismatch repair protein MutL
VEQAAVVSGGRGGVRVEGLTIQPMHARAGRNPQELFVNRRAVKNAAATHAVYDAYGAYLAKGQHPQFVLFLDVDPERVDVNVHPTKREVRFAEQDLVFQAVRSAVRAAIGADTGAAQAPREFGMPASPAGFPSHAAGQPAPSGSAGTGPAPFLYSRQADTAAGVPVAGEQVQTFLPAAEREIIPLGQLGRTYLVAQVGSELHVIDQHTAHERVLFERLCRARLGETLPSQPLLIPETVDVPAQHAVLLQRHLADLEQAGLTIEPFGAHTFVIRAVPALLKPLDYAALVLDLVDDLSQWNTTAPLETRLRSVMASLACHGAVRAGRPMELPEIKRLIEEWVEEGLPATCPHGRRVALRLPEDELNRIFGRA